MERQREMRRISIYIDASLVKEVQRLAKNDRRSVSFWVADLIEKELGKQENPSMKIPGEFTNNP